MDGCVGVFKTNRLFAQNYAKLDKRYGDVLGTFNGSAVHVVSLMELFVKGPICVLLYWAYVTRHPSRDALEFFTCVTQAYGTVVYLGQEAISGAINLEVDYQLSFSPYHLLYFWFAIFFGCVLYLIVPSILGWKSYLRLVKSTQFYAANAKA
ncbi:3-beta-hydroxysteroid-delta(8),delta(7)-isomerase [Angomonas deanei]|uniref:Emopamil binding protein, putative n=1 Tax=Angomonas deanei TaxID=59799 RepID=S9X4Q6_9TRYP|nr:3-beta-hydroxysteroid-delta(8),delta(7)-isomerase [Angomonas deanei]EPY43475.1 3-beta-hydroxysteroid-delta(8),delta(7)-isomerase [Angomonas deanei]CAD2212677.1 Emopamil binding protein, putative [Angomonas deanei]|eukprot:EPY39889.1 3-beta-hydroxysteroid-delta(8),delta(7)-isomerase [Angomonas deanei]